ncbi:peptide chain release factor N(5)-glutamine methyltransferase [candidate division FCPU426 bacterium]|nr:peptide chain release factor N(5)-glutamine methyltransferase [candidate division FCPU426 bacterium]
MQHSLSALYSWGVQQLRQVKIESPEKNARDLLMIPSHLSPIRLLTDPDLGIPAATAEKFRRDIRRRARHVPLQYLLGTEWFWGLPLRVGSGVLIPRPETELIIAQVKRFYPDGKFSGHVADLGTGSGNIALALGREYPRAKIIGVDISATALQWARRNKRLLKIRNVKFLHGDADHAISKQLYGGFSLVVSNPPYIPRRDIRRLQAEVQFEPRVALDGGQDGLRIIRKMLGAAGCLLHTGGLFILEVGIHQAPGVVDLMRRAKFKVLGAVEDWQQIPRILIGCKTKETKIKDGK